jgi:uncharacterized protein YcfL
MKKNEMVVAVAGTCAVVVIMALYLLCGCSSNTTEVVRQGPRLEVDSDWGTKPDSISTTPPDTVNIGGDDTRLPTHHSGGN